MNDLKKLWAKTILSMFLVYIILRLLIGCVVYAGPEMRKMSRDDSGGVVIELEW